MRDGFVEFPLEGERAADQIVGAGVGRVQGDRLPSFIQRSSHVAPVEQCRREVVPSARVLRIHFNRPAELGDRVLESAYPGELDALATQRACEEALRFAGLWHLRNQLVRTLPHGQQRLVELARAFAMRPKLIMLDEPAAGINPAEVEQLIKRIMHLRDLGITVLLIEHNMPLVMRIADHITVLNFGRKIGEGTPAGIRDDPEVIQAYLGHGKTKKEKTLAAA